MELLLSDEQRGSELTTVLTRVIEGGRREATRNYFTVMVPGY